MAGGVSYKWHGSQIAVSTSFAAESPTLTISAITKANPAVASATAHGLEDGDVIQINSAGGMTELNGGTFVVEKVDANSFKLLFTDSTGYGSYTSGAVVTQAQFSNYCQLTNYNRQGGSSPEVPTTTICSTAAEFELGLPDFGTTQLDYNFNLHDTVQQALQAADLSKDIVAVKVTLPKSGGVMVQLGKVQQTSEQAGNGGNWTGSTTIRNSGPRADFV